MIERLSKRTLTSKTFENGNGFKGQFHIGHIHYPSGLSKNGKLADIDTTLEYNVTSKTWGMTKASYDAEIGIHGDVRFHNGDGSVARTISNLSKIEAKPYAGSEFGKIGKGLIWTDLLGSGMHQIVEVRNGALVRIFRFERKPAFNEIDLVVDMAGLTFAQKPTTGKELIVSDTMELPTAEGRKIITRKPSAWNHRGDSISIQFKYYLDGTTLHMVKVIPQAFIDGTFTERGAWLETDDSDSYYAGAGDGSVEINEVVETANWTTNRNAAAGDLARPTATATNGPATQLWDDWVGGGNQRLRIARAFFPVDTSALADGSNIISAVLNVKPTNKGSNGTFVVIQTSQASTSTLDNADYSAIVLDSPNEGSSRLNIADAVVGVYNTVSLNSTGLGWIDKTGVSYIGLRQGNFDIDDSSPALGNSASYIFVNTSEQTGTDSDPYFDITYTRQPIVGIVGISTLIGASKIVYS